MNKIVFLCLAFALFMISCNQDEDLRSPEEKQLENIKATNELLRFNIWGFNDIVIDVTAEMRAIPLMANVADENGMVQPGQYNSFDIFGNDKRQEYYSYQFINTHIYRDTTRNDEFYKIGDFVVLRSNEMSVNFDSTSLVRYTYDYQESDGIFSLSSGQLGNAKINRAVNLIIEKSILSGKPNDMANAVVEKILGNEEIQAAIQQLLYDLIHGKIDQIAQSPEEISQKLAELVLEKLKEVDWETLVYNKVLEMLEVLKVDNPEQAAEELASKLSDKIETGLSQQDIYEAILPILQNFENETLPKLVPNIADAIFGLILNVFSEENIYEKIYPLWTDFAAIDSSSVTTVADTLGTVITNSFFDEEAIALRLEPFISILRTTPTIKIPALAQDIIDEVLIPKVDSLNANFPGLDVDPDWESIKTVLSSTLSILKSSLDDQTDAEAAASLADNIIGIMDRVISKGVEKAIFRLQAIPADQASQVIAAWINNLVAMAEPQLVEFLEEKLNELVDLFNTEEIAEELAAQIHAKIVEVFSAENIYTFLLPLMEQLSEINVEAAAQIITDCLFELDLIGDSITEEQVLEALKNSIAELIGNINVDEVTQKLLDLILQSELVQNIDGDVLKQLLELKIYELLIDLRNDLNAIDRIELSIIRK